MSTLENKSILLGVTGGVAIYKAVDLASKLTQAGALVDVVMTAAAEEFVKPLLFASITRREVHTNPFSPARKPGHIALAERPDVVLVAPATANTLAKIAAGIADNLLTDTLLATVKPVLVAPAMNCGMWNNPRTRRNIAALKADGFSFVGPGTGNLACGDAGVGRMAEPVEIIAALEALVDSKK
jgi:Phosphopantothenoylcysteine synthetase/decarboxylase